LNLRFKILGLTAFAGDVRFARLFAARIGRSPAHHVARLRIDAARRRIEEGASRLKDVARQCGFGDEQGLRRAFRRSVLTASTGRARPSRGRGC